MQRYLIITAGGSGVRMGTDRPKQFLDLTGEPVIIHTVKRFLPYVDAENIVVVLPELHLNEWKEIAAGYLPGYNIQTAIGGRQRFHSVQNGLKLLKGEGVVAIHDAVRPLVSDEVIKRCFDLAEEKGAAVPVVPVKESIRITKGDTSKAIDRSAYCIVQTPQCFNLSLIKNAYKQAFDEKFTDDAAVYEASGGTVFLTEGNAENVKITTPTDLVVARTYLENSGKEK